ncbi:hypothetical protein BH11PSE3_BH11PSE3_02050 [soil metagenome]
MLGRPGAQARQVKNTGDYDVGVTINRRGLRDDKDIAQATPADLVVVGDSFAWGWGIEAGQRFSNTVEAMTGVRTFNLATPTDLDGYEALLRYAEALGARIGRVVLAVCLENDLRLYDDKAAPEPSAAALGFADVKDWLENWSAAYLLATTMVHQSAWLNVAAVRLGVIIPNVEGMATNGESPAVVASSVDRVLRIAQRYPTIVMLIPSRGLWTGANRAVEHRVHRALLAALQQRGIEVLDLRPLLEAGGAPLGYHFDNDGHWNARGHRLAAQAIVDRLGRPGVERLR